MSDLSLGLDYVTEDRARSPVSRCDGGEIARSADDA